MILLIICKSTVKVNIVNETSKQKQQKFQKNEKFNICLNIFNVMFNARAPALLVTRHSRIVQFVCRRRFRGFSRNFQHGIVMGKDFENVAFEIIEFVTDAGKGQSAI